MLRFCLVGPTYPYRGGIAHYTTLLAQHLRHEHETLLLSFSRQYPRWLFPGKSDKDPSKRPLRTKAEYLLDPLNPISWWRTLRRIREWKPDVVVIPWWVPFWAPAWAVLGRGIKRLPERPRLLFICHNVLPHEQGRLSQFLLPSLLKLALAPGDGFIVHSEADRKVLRRFFSQANILVVPLPTYQALGQLKEVALPVELPKDRPLLLFCGFVRPYKGLDILLDAIPLVLAKRPLHLLIAGEFWHGTAEYRAQIERLALQDAVTIIDEYIPDEVLAAYMNRADVVILPYRNATQSAIIQLAFGHGKPVITTNVGGLGEVVEDGRTGLVVPPDNPQTLAKAIERYFDEELKSVFREQIQIGNHRFSWTILLDTLFKLSQDPALRNHI
ncbi:MAG: glycosyltransferase [Anaerolineae bacterium]